MHIRLALPSDLPPVRDRLRSVLGPQRPEHQLDPVSQLIKSVLSSRTYDEVAWAAFIRLRAAYRDWEDLVHAAQEELEPIIDPVTFADQKARQLPILIRVLLLKRGELNLDFLGKEPVEESMAWLMRLPGVGVKIAAAVLNLSTMNHRALVVDTHVHRVARRLGLTARTGDAREAYDSLMDQAPVEWQGEQLYELHWLLKGHGQSLCTHFDPACGLCALRDVCPRVGVSVDQERRVIAFDA
ncbi:endonuclease III [Phenylobacterium sp.]|uniref:endonuclease III domain-containing protein n=1 Tax=Phenylobacterium sp. TaxID=1871053 RepID=UPI00271EE261|nr:endonuclease III [Phenylobacterium sp.]MDO8378855.1 endonuclease III [Phenylobacterium sp.]